MTSDWEVVQKAADIVQRRGMCVGTLLDQDGRVCADGALALATGMSTARLAYASKLVYGDGEFRRICGRVADALNLPRTKGPYVIDATMRVFRWNDSVGFPSNSQPTRYEFTDVVEGLRAAAERIRTQDKE